MKDRKEKMRKGRKELRKGRSNGGEDEKTEGR